MNNNEKELEKGCKMRHTDIIKLTNRQISWLIVIVIFIALGSFSGGYFWGEKKSAERFLQRVGQDALADQVYSSICSLYDTDSDTEQHVENSATEDMSKEEPESEVQEKMVPKVAYYAQLVGFGTTKKAKQFVERLEKDKIVAYVRERKSKTARGKVINWYQVVTDPYTDKDALIALVEKVKIKERLHDVRIVTI